MISETNDRCLMFGREIDIFVRYLGKRHLTFGKQPATLGQKGSTAEFNKIRTVPEFDCIIFIRTQDGGGGLRMITHGLSSCAYFFSP